MRTRDKILGKSQELFNKNGVGKVSVRSICEELGISLGNFTYHFPDKQQIVVELYQKMIRETDELGSKITIGRESISFLLEYHKHIFNIQNNYRFFYLSTFELLTSSPTIREAYLQYMKAEKMKAKVLLQSYIQNGVLQNDLSSTFLERLINISQMINSFWMIDAELRFKGKEHKKLIHYLELCCSLIEPHLTDSSLKEYKLYFKNLKK